MKKILLLYGLLTVGFFANAQKEANIWYFGNRVGLDFNRIPPSPIFQSAMSSLEGSAVISDHNGKLLFYTNGVGLINRKQTPMKNGNNLLGDLSSTDNTVIVPAPGNDSIYYLFTIGAAYQQNKGFRYDVINMKGDGGFGEVVDKNVLLQPLAYEKLSAIRHCNNKDVWVMIHKWDSDEYHAYLVTSAGLNTTPVISHTGFFISGAEDNAIGTLRFSIDGRKLAAVHSYENNVIELMDFNNSTGQVSNPVVFRPDPVGLPQTFTGAYSAAFSPNSNLLYVSDNPSSDEPSYLYQFDISSHNATTILASKQIIARPSPWFSGVLQIGPDQKIYMAMLSDTSLSVIEDPNIYGTGCNYNYNKIFLAQNNTTPVQFGLPNFIQSYFNPLSNPYDFSRTGNCTDHDVRFSINKLTGIDSVKWDFGDGQRSQSLAPVNRYAAGGTYDVKLIVYKVDCSGLNDTVIHRIWIADAADFLGIDQGSCGLPALTIGIDEIDNANYTWNTGSGDNRIIADTFATYWLRVEQNGCTVTDSINIFKLPAPIVRIRGDSVVCLNAGTVLNATNSLATSYLWSTGETTPSIFVNNIGLYKVTVTGNSCLVSDSVLVGWGECEAFVPTAFTPNKDGLNDKFGVASGFNAIDFSMKVFGRWGDLIFSSSNIALKWDGTFKGKTMPGGVYTWIMSYINSRGYKRYFQGTVLLVR